MDDKRYKTFTVWRPKDESLEAYKAWMTEIAERLAGDETVIRWTEEEWIANWKKFWHANPSG
jgi:hypothetical protein